MLNMGFLDDIERYHQATARGSTNIRYSLQHASLPISVGVQL